MDDAQNLMEDETKLVTPRSNGAYFVTKSNDTIYDQINLKLKNEFGKTEKY